MFTMMVFWCVIRVAFLTIVIPMINDIRVVDWVYPLTWALSTITLLIYYFFADWVHGFEKEKKAVH